MKATTLPRWQGRRHMYRSAASCGQRPRPRTQSGHLHALLERYKGPGCKLFRCEQRAAYTALALRADSGKVPICRRVCSSSREQARGNVVELDVGSLTTSRLALLCTLLSGSRQSHG